MFRDFAVSIAVHLVLLGSIFAWSRMGDAPIKTFGTHPPLWVSADNGERQKPRTSSAKSKPSPEKIASSPLKENTVENPGWNSGAAQNYALEIRSKIQSRVVYPVLLRKRGISGRVVLKLLIAQDGALRQSQVLESSRHPELDEIAMKAVQEAAPFSARSPIDLTLHVPIDFQLSR